jgi:tetratricopeptide (TPR) repeat protein
MPESWLDKDSLAFYHSLAKRLREGHLSPAEAAVECRQVLPSPAVVKRLRAEAEERIWHVPREGWALAHIAYAVARELQHDLLQAECALTLALTLNMRGEFAGAIPLCQEATAVFATFGRHVPAAHCCWEQALAHAELRRPESALACLEQTRVLLGEGAPPSEVARCDRLEARIRHYQGRRAEAVALAERARAVFSAGDQPLELARSELELVRALFLDQPKQALTLIHQAHSVFEAARHGPEVAVCDYYRALALQEVNRYPEALASLQQARAVFAEHGMDFFAAMCDNDLNVVYWRMNRYDEALAAGVRARAYFAARGIAVWVAICEVNLAIVHYALNRYDDALSLYAQAAELCSQQDLPVDVARCHENMALIYQKQGRYDRALALHQRARETFAAHGLDIYAAICDENVAGTYRRLGRHEEALEHYRRAREAFTRRGMHVYMARCDAHMADLYLALGRHGEALTCLEQARATCLQEGMVVHVAACDREMARVQARMGHGDEARALLAQARAVFAERGLLVDAALCDLAAGEVYLNQGEVAEAVPFLTAALAVLDPGFPDEAWRAWYGLGHCALLEGDRHQALEHWLSAIELTNQIRVTLPTERLSGGFFASRRQLHKEALELALEVGATEQALAVAEASKAQTFLALRAQLLAETWTSQRGWGEVGRGDPYLAKLLSQEERLRREMELLRRELRLLEADEAGPVLRSEGKLHSDQPQALARLAELARAYEEVVERLRLAGPGWLDAHSLMPFSVQALRQAATAYLPVRWACLSYYVLDDTLVTFYLDAQRVTVHRRPLNAYDRLALRQCTDPAGEFRELIYRGTIRGHRAPGAPGRTYLQHLYRLLMPPEVEDLGEDNLLLIAPCGPLHGLAFQALLADETPLVTRVPMTYVPSLGALQLLLREPTGSDSIGRALVCGLSDFGSRGSPLPHAADEVAVLREVLGERLDVLWGAEATREALLHLNETGGLGSYDVIHFATHAVLDRMAPSQSRVLLADSSLTLADVLNLRLRTWMVVLSACGGAMGQRYPGDEIMGLAQAFFIAGARTVVASLWPVEDASAGEFMGRFYRRLGAGEGVAQALRAVQVEMAGEGYAPYQWAPFIAIGLP